MPIVSLFSFCIDETTQFHLRRMRSMFAGPPRKRRFCLAIVLSTFVACLPCLAWKHDFANVQSRLAPSHGRIPVACEPNRGQAAPEVRYVCRLGGYNVSLTSGAAIFQGDNLVRRQRFMNASDSIADGTPNMGLSFLGAAPDPNIVGLDRLPGKTHYLSGADPFRWHTNIPQFAKVRYMGIYPGIDLIYHGSGTQLEFDFRIAPGADPNRIRMHFEGAGSIEVGHQGSLVIRIPTSTVRFLAPFVYQMSGSTRKPLVGRYVVAGPKDVMFQLGSYDRKRTLIIDPVLLYSSYIPQAQQGNGVAVDSLRNTYLVSGGYVTKINSAGSAVVYSAFLGELLTGVAVNGSGNAFVTGTNILVAKLNSAGSSILFSKHLGSSSDYGLGIALDTSGNAYVAGAASGLIATSGAYQRSCVSLCAFAAKVSPTGTVGYATFVGGVSVASAVAVDRSGNAYITGFTGPTGFPTTANAVFRTFRGGQNDAFVTKLNSTGSALLFSTFLGGSGADNGNAIAIDQSGNAYVAGATRSFADFPITPGAFQTKYTPCCDDAFVTKVSADGSRLVYSSYLGGNNVDIARGIAVDQYNQAYIVGQTRSSNFPQTSNRLQNFAGGTCGSTNGFPNPCDDAFIITLNAAGSHIVYYSTLLGGSSSDGALGVAIDPALNVYVTGFTASTNFPTRNAIDTQKSALNEDGFIAKLVIAADLSATASAPSSTSVGSNLSYTFAVLNAGPDGADGANLTAAIPAGTTFVSYTTTNGSCSASAASFTCKRSSRLLPAHSWGPVTLTVKIGSGTGGKVTNSVRVKSNTQDLKLSNNSATTTTFVN
jgi:uncharacterized repeat protein (TIGR01451 family)